MVMVGVMMGPLVLAIEEVGVLGVRVLLIMLVAVRLEGVFALFYGLLWQLSW